MHSNCRMSPFQRRAFDRSDIIPNGRQQHRPMRPTEPSYNKVPDTTVPSAPGTPEAMCCGGASAFRTHPPEQTLLSLLTANESTRSYFTTPPPPPTLPSPSSSVTSNVVSPAPVQHIQHDPSEQVVVKDGCVFYIRYVDESLLDGPLVERSNGDDEFVEADSLPSIANDLSMLLDNSMFPEGGVHGSIADELGDEGTVRDWINYDELPLLNQQKQQQPVPTADHISRRSSNDTRVAGDRCNNCHKPVRMTESLNVCDVCWCGVGVTPPMCTSSALSSPEQEPTTVTLVPDFSYYCVECEKFFPSSSSLQEHMELNHRLINESMPVMTTIPRAAYTEPGTSGSSGYVWPCSTIVDSTNQCAKMPFFCDLCNISFNLADSYYMHNYSVHGRISTDYR